VMPKINWLFIDDDVYPQCSRCGDYPLSFKGFMRIEGIKRERYYLMECNNCGRVYARKTNIDLLRKKALERWGH